MPDFAHLHVHSEYSLLDGLASIDDLVSQAKSQGMRALALTDHGTMHGVVEFYKQAKAAGIAPVIGCEVYVAARGMEQRQPKLDAHSYHLTLRARTFTGYRNLVSLVTQAHLDGYYYKPRIDLHLLERRTDGIVALSGCLNGQVARHFLEGNEAEAKRIAIWFKERFGRDGYYLELQDHQIEEQVRLNRFLLDLCEEVDLPVVCTNDVHYAKTTDYDVHETLLCIQTGTTLQDPKRMRMSTNNFYLKSPDEMAALFGELPDALSNSIEIAESCDVQFAFGRVNLPQFTLPPGHSADSYLRAICEERVTQRYAVESAEVRRRLEYELDVIERTQIAPYILVVWDMVNWGREHGIAGEPRGSAAGSIVAYISGLSSVDPLENDLMFERFLTPARAGVRAEIDFPEYPFAQFLAEQQAPSGATAS